MRGEECLYRDTRRETGEEEGIDTCERGRVFVQGHKKGDRRGGRTRYM